MCTIVLGVLLMRLWDAAGVHPVGLGTKKREERNPSKQNSITT